MAIAFHRISPPFFIQAWLQQYSRRSFFYSAYRFFSSTIRLGSMRCRKFDDSMLNLHRICQIPLNCQCKWLSAFLTSRATFFNSFPAPEKFLFCTDKMESIEWPDLVPRLRIGDCFEIHLLHWGLCDLLYSSHQTFLLEVLLRQCAFCKELLSSWLASRLRNFDLSGRD